MDYEDATHFAIAVSIVGTVTAAPVTTLFFGASVSAVLSAWGDHAADAVAFKVLLPLLFVASAKSAKYVLHTAIPALQSRFFHFKRSLKAAARTAAQKTVEDVASHPLAAASALGIGYALFHNQLSWCGVVVPAVVTYLLVKKMVDANVVGPTVALAVQAGSVSVAAAHFFVDVVDRATDAALDVLTETVPRATFRGVATAISKARTAAAAMRHKAQHVLIGYRKKIKKVKLAPLAAGAAAAACGLVKRPILKTAEFVKDIPEGAALAYAGGLVAGILQVLVLHAVHLVVLMANSPTDAWAQMTALEKAADVGQYLVEITPYLPAFPFGMVLLVVSSVGYAGLFLHLLRPESVKFEFNVEAEKEFVTVTVPGLVKSAWAAVASKVASVAAALATKLQSFYERALSTVSVACERIGAVSSRGAGSSAVAHATAGSTAASNDDGSKAVPAGTSFRSWLESAATHPIVSYLAFPLSCAFLMQQHSFSASSPLNELSDLYSSIEASISAAPHVVSLVAAFRAALSKAAFFAAEILSPTWSKMLQSAKPMFGPLILKMGTGFFGSKVSVLLIWIETTFLQQVPLAAASLVTKAAALAVTVQESIEHSVNQVLQTAADCDITAFFRFASSMAAAAASDTASYATSLFQATSCWMLQACTIGVDAAASCFRHFVSASSSFTARAPAALSHVQSSIGPMTWKLHGAIRSIEDAVLELIAPRLESLAAVASASASKVSMIAVSIQEFMLRSIHQVQMLRPLPEGFVFYSSAMLVGLLLYAYRELVFNNVTSLAATFLESQPIRELRNAVDSYAATVLELVHHTIPRRASLTAAALASKAESIKLRVIATCTSIRSNFSASVEILACTLRQIPSFAADSAASASSSLASRLTPVKVTAIRICACLVSFPSELHHRLNAKPATAAAKSDPIRRSKRSSPKSKARKTRGRRNSHRPADATKVTSKFSKKMHLLSSVVWFAVAAAFAVHGLRSHVFSSGFGTAVHVAQRAAPESAKPAIGDHMTNVTHLHATVEDNEPMLASPSSIEKLVHPAAAMPKPAPLGPFHRFNRTTATILFFPSDTPSPNGVLPQLAIPEGGPATVSASDIMATPDITGMPRAARGVFTHATASQATSSSDPLTRVDVPPSVRRTGHSNPSS
jgi:ElaB/YqjD/DUF883 family membrane-anchored ribosome-binding protein/HAMP domain-containing protein